MMPYEKLEAWRLSHQLALDVYASTERWARSERYELTSQARRGLLKAAADGRSRHPRTTTNES
jgi:hypothetical protein